ncbi:hypothetical protein ELH27_34420 [Rhizobium leguminosarum]|uniref:Uncharacterized protein n=1 Tax=Rhizobium beringeri TaxID=3019934 RepID=A0ABY1XHI3_9HYPH|nr:MULTISPECIES: hypothetical protein [Rhizobium]TBC54646.1 hypothetical protein ELH27_34420 [Rhizobium leguminosarum]TBC91786.1 hypothetical protein ELH21_26545 [Rhizobium leguminosarum]TBE58179.1 hypothetical protein ELH03_34575 [Rhizobium beringeri]
MRTLLRSVIAGFAALAASFAILGMADRLGIVTARGEFQRLVKSAVGPYLSDMGLPAIRSSFHLPSPQSSVFMVGFEIAVWMGMALACGFIERHFPGPPLIKGLIYAALIWLINAGIVSPAFGEGFAGRRAGPLGIASATAHACFFIILSLLI